MVVAAPLIVTPDSFHDAKPCESLGFGSGERRGATRVGKRVHSIGIRVKGSHVTGSAFPPTGLVRGHGPAESDYR
jgi:hypothetical protein